jgi:hypothetical protein
MKTQQTLAAAALIIATSCAPHRAYHPENGAYCPADRQEERACVNVIEFDEQGDYFASGQYKAAVKRIRGLRRPLVVTFAHGWRHNAEPEDRDMVVFTKFIKDLQNSHSDRDVHGIYIGWRGGSAARAVDGAAGPFTFWNRKSASQRLKRFALLNTLLAVSSAVRGQGEEGVNVVIGHSFGARILEEVTGNAVVSAMGLPGERGKRLPFDAVFLINPASESLSARMLKLALQGWPHDRPIFYALSSKTDGPNKVAWPLGVGLQRAFNVFGFADQLGKTRTYPTPDGEAQWSYLSQTAGMDARQVTHFLSLDGASSSEGAAGRVITSGSLAGGRRWSLVEYASKKEAAYTLNSKAYWVTRVPKEALDGHSGDRATNGIFNDDMTSIMTGLVKFATAGAKTRGTPKPTLTADAVDGVLQKR